MFRELPLGWDSKISLRGAMLNAVGFGFAAGIAFGVLIVKALLLSVRYPELVELLLLLVTSIAVATRFYFLAMSRAQEQSSVSRT